MRRLFVVAGVAALLVWMGCSADGESLFRDGLDASDDASTGPGPFGTLDSGTADGGFSSCDDGGTCQQGAVCKYGLCIPDLGKCATNDDCPGDSYCDTDLTCVPYGVPPTKINDPSCAKPFSPGTLNPTVQCEWAAPPDAGDPISAMVNVYSAPIVADLNLDLDKNKLQPSVILTTWAQVNGPDGGSERIGVLRVFDGRTCAEQMRIGGPDDPDVEQNRPAYGTQWAVGDLDGDVGAGNTGHPEIVGMHRTTGTISTNPPLSLIAFRGLPRRVLSARLRRSNGRPARRSIRSRPSTPARPTEAS